MTTGTNIFNHVIDDASTVTVFNTTTPFSSDNVQGCLEELDPHVVTGLGTIPTASETVEGLVRISTLAESLNTSNNSTAITPYKLNYWLANNGQATETVFGTIKIATNTDLQEGSDDSRAITVAKLNYYADTVRPATMSIRGFARLSTQALAEAGSDNTTAMTPLRVKQAFDAWGAGLDVDSTETVKGIIRIATTSEANNDTLNNLAMTPYNLNYRSGTLTKRGLYYLPTQAIADARTSNDHAVTVGTLSLFQATATKAGSLKLVNSLTSTATDAALSAAQGKILNDDKIGSAGGTITGTLKVNTMTKVDNTPIMSDGRFTASALLNAYPVNSLYMSMSATNPGSIFGGTWVAYSQGRVLLGAGSTTDARGENKTFTAGSTGGEFNHALTIPETPEHKHAGWGEHQNNGTPPFGWATEYGKNNVGSNKTDKDNYLYWSSPVGGNQPHNNMQPYLVCYIWLRTA